MSGRLLPVITSLSVDRPSSAGIRMSEELVFIDTNFWDDRPRTSVSFWWRSHQEKLAFIDTSFVIDRPRSAVSFGGSFWHDSWVLSIRASWSGSLLPGRRDLATAFAETCSGSPPWGWHYLAVAFAEACSGAKATRLSRSEIEQKNPFSKSLYLSMFRNKDKQYYIMLMIVLN